MSNEAVDIKSARHCIDICGYMWKQVLTRPAWEHSLTLPEILPQIGQHPTPWPGLSSLHVGSQKQMSKQL